MARTSSYCAGARRAVATLTLLVTTAMLAACAHPMIMRPDLAAVAAAPDAHRIAKHVGLYISPANRSLEVQSAGGGGDKVSYHPYADLEVGLFKVLGNVFESVTSLDSNNDVAAIRKNALNYIVVPEIKTSTSSSGVLTWMATDMTVKLTCRITDAAGATVTSVAATGDGHAVFSELKGDFSLAGERASLQALQNLQSQLLQATALQ